jgi:selenocysteine lyase/cysteine desulfurase
MTTPIEHKDFDGIRITPNIYTTRKEIDVFCSAVERLVGATRVSPFNGKT